MSKWPESEFPRDRLGIWMCRAWNTETEWGRIVGNRLSDLRYWLWRLRLL